ncbi:hypothetical protein HII28_16520 [Planctomonas sp. JC2975]|uniref:hypothetical protein n=1 Tax=Planctomonas sp. JC2975 TaxID=2729626 RepID=UPI0014739E82|nr:hypothetical protein [Planctomonas sp. JC2975]NNC13473.1 hypothetical protein [Planctomonas sp. JC2975]
MNLKRIGAVIGAAALLATGAVVGIAAPASAHTGAVKGTAQCQTDGTYTVTWTYTQTQTPNGDEADVKVITHSPEPSTLYASAVGVSHPVDGQLWLNAWRSHQNSGGQSGIPARTGNWTASFTQSEIKGSAKAAEVAVQTDWRGWKSADSGGTVQLGGDCAVAPAHDAIAQATVNPPTCASASTVQFAIENASWDSSSYSTEVGKHSRSATAAGGHLFSNGKSTTTVTYEVQDELTGGDCTPTSYQTVVWQMPTKPADSNSATWPQTFVSVTPETTETLDVAVPDTCGTYYQVDSYVDNATTQALLAAVKNGTNLTSPGNPAESLAPGGLNTAWKFVINPDCKQVVVPHVTSTDNVCGNGTSNATLTLPAVEGVVWHVNNPATDQAPGTYPMNVGGPNVITASAAAGYSLAQPFEQDVTFGPVKTNQSTNPQADCYVPPTITACDAQLPVILASNLDNAGWNYTVRSAGHYDYTPATVKVWTDDASGNALVAGVHAVDIPLQDAGSPAIDLTNASGAAPGLRLGIHLNGEGSSDGDLVYQGAGQWATDAHGFGVAAGSGFASLGTLQDYLAKNPEATIVSVGFQLGAGEKGSAEIVSITVGCQTFTFDSKPTAVTAVATDASGGLADTGSNLVFPLAAGGAIILLGGAAIAFVMIRRRRSAGEQ